MCICVCYLRTLYRVSLKCTALSNERRKKGRRSGIIRVNLREEDLEGMIGHNRSPELLVYVLHEKENGRGVADLFIERDCM